MTIEAWGILLALAVVAYFLIKQEKEAPSVEQPPAAPTAVPPVVQFPFTGNYHFEIVPPDHAKWGEGIHPDEVAGTAQTRGDWAPGLQYRLDGQGSFARSTEGRLTGLMHVCGAPCRIDVSVPVNGGAVGFATDGVHVEFHFDGMKLSGIVYEPRDKENKYGTVVGRKI